MTTQQAHNQDDGIGFDMRNAQLYQDSDDEEEEHIHSRHKPHLYNKQNDNSCNCCYILLILLIIAIGSLIGYSLGATFNTSPKEFNPVTDPPNKQTSSQIINKHFYSANYIIGADMSYVDKEDCNGSCSPFKISANSATEDSLKMLKDYGFTTIRMRIWNNPSSSNSYCNLQGALFMANRTFKAGLKYHLDFHYSDNWADPAQQTKPAAWATLYGNDLVNAVYSYTFNVLSALKKQGTTPQSVQIGNEIDSGMLWAPNGQPCDHGGYIDNPCQDNWSYFAQLVGAGVKATRDVDPSIEIMIHTSLGNKLASGSSAVSYIETWYSKLYNTYNVKFDSIGLSFYPGWCKCALSQVNLLSNLMNSFKGCSGGLYLAETSYPYNPNITYDWSSTYPFTPEGQLEYVEALMGIVKSNKVKGLRGFMWWGTEYYHVVQNDVNAPLWDWNAIALPALLKGFLGI